MACFAPVTRAESQPRGAGGTLFHWVGSRQPEKTDSQVLA